MKREMIINLHLVALVLLQIALSESATAAGINTHQCGLASVYSTLSEETASGEDTRSNNLTAAHRSLPFGTLVQVDNQENGHSAVVQITDRGPFARGRIIDVSQAAAYELGFSGLTRICLKILLVPESRSVKQR